MTTLTRAFRQPTRQPSETPALIRRETWDDVGLIAIGGKSYGYRCYPGHLTCKRIVRLFSDNGFGGESYDVSFHTDRRPVCTCADFEFRRKGETGESCKHIRAVVALGLDRTDAEVIDAIEADAAALERAVAEMTEWRQYMETAHAGPGRCGLCGGPCDDLFHGECADREDA